MQEQLLHSHNEKHFKAENVKKRPHQDALPQAEPPMFSEKGELAQYRQYEKLFEMDVAYTLQKDLEEQSDAADKERVQKETEDKLRRDKALRDKEESVITVTIKQYYDAVEEYMATVKVEGEEDHFNVWHKKVLGLKRPVDKYEERKKSRSKSPVKKQGAEEIKEIKEEVKVVAKEVSPEKEAVKGEKKKLFTEERVFMKNLFMMLRDMDALTNRPGDVIRLFKDQKEKARFGVLWAKGDDDASRMILRFFRKEHLFHRLRIIYTHKIETQGKYRHLKMWGFYQNLTDRQRLLRLIDCDYPQSAHHLRHVRLDHEHLDSITKEYSVLVPPTRYDTVSVEEMCQRYEVFGQAERQAVIREEVRIRHAKRGRHQDFLLTNVLGKKRKDALEVKLAGQKTEVRLAELAKPKDKWKRLKILMELRKKFAHDITLEKMIKEELKSNRVFKYPDEYDLYDDQEDKLCKHMGEKGIQTKDLAAGKDLRDKFKALDDQDLYYLRKEVNGKRRVEKELERFVIGKAVEYLEQKKKRL